MARFTAAWRTGGAGSTTLPIASIYGVTGVRARVREIGVFNTTTTAVAIALRRATTAGTAGTGQTELSEDDTAQTALATCFDTHSAGPTLSAGNLRVASLGAAIGSGVIWTFGGNGLVIPNTTGDGVCIVPLTGTGQICDVSITWDE